MINHSKPLPFQMIPLLLNYVRCLQKRCVWKTPLSVTSLLMWSVMVNVCVIIFIILPLSSSYLCLFLFFCLFFWFKQPSPFCCFDFIFFPDFFLFFFLSFFSFLYYPRAWCLILAIKELKRLQNNGRPYHVQKEYLNHNVGWGATADNGFLFSLKFESAKRMSMHISGRKRMFLITLMTIIE